MNLTGMTKGLLYMFLILLVLLLQYKLWLAPGGALEMHQLRKQSQQQSEHNLTLEQHNEALRAEVNDLKKGEDAVEEYARSELGMLKEDEVFYRVVQSSGSH